MHPRQRIAKTSVLKAVADRPSSPVTALTSDSLYDGPPSLTNGAENVSQHPKLRHEFDRAKRINEAPARNRIMAVLAHTTRYAFKPEERLATDCHVASSTISRLVNGQSSPSFALMTVIAAALEKEFNKVIDPRELVTYTDQFPTQSVCTLCNCRGCLPIEAFDEEERLKPEYRSIKPGEWSLPNQKAPLAAGR